MVTKIRPIVVTATTCVVLAGAGAASAANAPDAKRLHGLELQANRFHGTGPGAKRSPSLRPDARRIHRIRVDWGRVPP
jgi:hypothetical protein